MARGSSIAYLRTLLETARACAPTIVEGRSGRLQRDTVDRRLRRWADNSVEAARARVNVHGLENFDSKQTFVVMSNHQSNYDILALYYAYPGSLRMVAKQEMRRLPLLGAAMEAAEFIFVDRRNNTAARAALDVAKTKIKSGISIWIAPEGTRSKTGQLGEFKKGGFMLALSTETPILPCTVVGTRDVMPIKAATLYPSRTIDVTFHAPIDVKDYGIERRDELMERVRASIDSALP